MKKSVTVAVKYMIKKAAEKSRGQCLGKKGSSEKDKIGSVPAVNVQKDQRKSMAMVTLR